MALTCQHLIDGHKPASHQTLALSSEDRLSGLLPARCPDDDDDDEDDDDDSGGVGGGWRLRFSVYLSAEERQQCLVLDRLTNKEHSESNKQLQCGHKQRADDAPTQRQLSDLH